MDNKLLVGLSEQINKELYSAYLYFAMSLYFTDINMEGFAKTVKNHAKEELDHAKRIYNYLITRNQKITLYPIESPQSDWINATDAIEAALNHEKVVTSSINRLYEIAKEVKDYAGEVFLHWFIDEQVEEEFMFQSLLDKIKSTEKCDCEIVHIDRDLRLDKNYLE